MGNIQKDRPRPRPRNWLAPFQRVTTSGRFIPQIDGLRCVAIGSVMLYHIESYVSRKIVEVDSAWTDLPARFIAKTGWVGVPLFFVISGFVLALPFATWRLSAGRPVKLASYYWRRVTRLEVPFALSLLLILPIVVLGRPIQDLAAHFFATLFYSHSLAYGKFSPISNVTWSLEIEVQFYLLAPLFALLFAIGSKALRRGLLLGLMVGMAVVSRMLDPQGRLGLTLLGYSQYFFAGFLLADVYVEDWKQNPTMSRGWDVVSLVGWPALFSAIYLMSSNPTADLIRAAISPPLIVLLYVAAFRGPVSARVLSIPFVTVVGGMCYSIYLLHNELIPLLFRATKFLIHGQSLTLNVLVQALVMVPMILLVGGLFFRVVERPCMERDWPSKLWKRVTGKTPDVAPAEAAATPSLVASEP